jgi:hypothetical protein
MSDGSAGFLEEFENAKRLRRQDALIRLGVCATSGQWGTGLLEGERLLLQDPSDGLAVEWTALCLEKQASGGWQSREALCRAAELYESRGLLAKAVALRRLLPPHAT